MDPREFCAQAVAYLKPALAEGTVDVVLSDDDEPIIRDLGNGLLVLYLVDLDDHFAYVQRRHLRAAGVTPDELHERSLANLARIADEKMTVYDYHGYFSVIMDGHFEASLLLLDDLWNETFSWLVPGEYVVAIPARDILSFAGLDEGAAFDKLRGVVSRVGPNPDHPITPNLYRRHHGVWQVINT
jgi:uncharacterized protein YtpQ (UPF0354 family)